MNGQSHISCMQEVLKGVKNTTDNPSVIIYVSKTENRITFKEELLTHETMKVLGSTRNQITKDEDSKNVPHSEITELIKVHCNVVNNGYRQIFH